VDNDPSFVTSAALLQYLRQQRKVCGKWIDLCTRDGVTLAGGRAALQAISAVYKLLALALQAHQGNLAASNCAAMVPYGVMGMLLCWNIPESIASRLHSEVADAVSAAAQLVRVCKQHGEGNKGFVLMSLQGGVYGRQNEAMEGLWKVLGAGAAIDSTQQLDAAYVQLLAALLDVRAVSVPSGLAALTVSKLCRMLAAWLERVPGQSQAQQQEVDGSKAAIDVVCSIAACLGAVAGGSSSMQLTLLENVHVLPALSAMLRVSHLEGAAMKLLSQLATSIDRQGQGLVTRQQGLLAGLMPLLGHGVLRCKVVVLLRTLVLANGAAQLAVARVPGMCAGLVQLLGCEEGEVADEAAEMLAALQHDSSEAQALVREAGRGMVMVLQ
jgi:hypothetical protein